MKKLLEKIYENGCGYVCNVEIDGKVVKGFYTYKEVEDMENEVNEVVDLELLNYSDINFDHKPYNAYVFCEGDEFECGGSCLAPNNLKVGDKVNLGRMEGICIVKSIHWKEN